jgi:hypothetical protein
MLFSAVKRRAEKAVLLDSVLAECRYALEHFSKYCSHADTGELLMKAARAVRAIHGATAAGEHVY